MHSMFPGSFYSNDPKIVLDDEWLIDVDKIESLKQYSKVVLDFSSEHWGDVVYDIYDSLTKHGINFVLLSYNPLDHNTRPCLFFFPHWYHWGRKSFRKVTVNHGSKKYTWGCLNANPRPHRIFNYLYSRSKSYFDQAYFTMYNRDEDDEVFAKSTLDADSLAEWDIVKQTLPHGKVLGITYNNFISPDTVIDLPAITDAYINLVTETTVISNVFVTEKTWKPISSGQLFLILGNPGTIAHLRSLGVDVFDDVVDHSYDSEPDWKNRIRMIHRELEKLLNSNPEQLYSSTQQRRQSNIEKFYLGEFDNQYYQTILACINDQL